MVSPWIPLRVLRRLSGEATGCMREQLTKLHPERRSFADFGLDTKASSAELDYLPNESQTKAGTLAALLSTHLCLIEGR